MEAATPWDCLANLLGSVLAADSWVPWLRLTIIIIAVFGVVVLIRATHLA